MQSLATTPTAKSGLKGAYADRTKKDTNLAPPEEFYYNKIIETFNELPEELKGENDWEKIKKGFFTTICRVQVKYGLGFLMLLAYGSLDRAALRKVQKISPKLLTFWILLSRELQTRSKDNELLWNVYFADLSWGIMTRAFIKSLDYTALKTIISDAKHDYNKEKKERF